MRSTVIRTSSLLLAVFVLALVLPSIGWTQQTPLKRGSDAWREYNRRIVEEALKEKMHFKMPLTPSSTLDSQAAPWIPEQKDGDLSPLALGEEIVNTYAVPESEVHAAINPKDSTNIVVSPIRLGSSLIMPIFYSKDFGKTWKQSNFKTQPYSLSYQVGGGGDPVLTFDADGKLYISWIDIYISPAGDTEFAAIFWASSTDGGATFTRVPKGYISYIEQPLNQGPLSGFSDKEWMTADRTPSPYHNTVYCAYANLNSVTGARIQVVRKTPQDVTFEEAVDVSPDSLFGVQYTSIGVDRSGGLHVTYLGSPDGSNYGLYQSYSTDGGQSFSTTVRVSAIDDPNNSPDAVGQVIQGVRINGNYPCAHLSIDTSGEVERMYMVWCAFGIDQNENHGADIFFSFSDDHGMTWSPAKVLNDDIVTSQIDHFYPSIAVNASGAVMVTWYDRRTDPNNMSTYYYMAVSFDHGNTWKRNAPVSKLPTDFNTVGNQNGGFGIGEYTQVLTTKNYAIPVWTDGRKGNGYLNIYAAFIPLDPNNAIGVNAVRLQSVASGFELMENYPNPFGTSTTFAYRIDARSHVKFTVSNVLGQEVATLTNGMKEPGNYSLQFKSTGLPNGTYVYRLDTDMGSAWRTMVIAK